MRRIVVTVANADEHVAPIAAAHRASFHGFTSNYDAEYIVGESDYAGFVQEVKQNGYDIIEGD